MAEKEKHNRVIEAAESHAGESYEEKVIRLLERAEGSANASDEVVNAQPGYVYRWTPGPEDKSQGAIGARAKLESMGYEIATDGEYFARVTGGICWRIPTPVYEVYEQQKLARLADKWRRLGVDPESLQPTVVIRGSGPNRKIETYI